MTRVSSGRLSGFFFVCRCDTDVLSFCTHCAGLDAVEKKEGIPQNRNINEKVTDGARGMFESATGCVYLFILVSFTLAC